MNHLRSTSIVLVVATAVLLGLPAVAGAQGIITINGCSSLTLVSGTTFQCNATTPDPSGPTGCSVTPATTSLPASGGNVNLIAGCTGGAAVSSITWTKNGNPFGGVFPDALPASSGSSSAPDTYTYVATFNWSGAPAVTKSAVATVASSSPPPTGTIACTGYSIKTVDLSIPASANQNFDNRMSPGQITIGRFRAPKSADPSVGIGHQSDADSSIFRTYTLVTNDPCTFGTSGPNVLKTSSGKSVLWYASVGPGQLLALEPGKEYYFIVQNQVKGVATCTAQGSACGGFFELVN